MESADKDEIQRLRAQRDEAWLELPGGRSSTSEFLLEELKRLRALLDEPRFERAAINKDWTMAVGQI
jgi:hypothetical protein